MATEVTSSQLFQLLGSLYAEVKMLDAENALLRQKLMEATRANVREEPAAE